MTYDVSEVNIGGLGGVQRWAQNQFASLEDQLDMGVRFIDIRLRHVKESFTIHHGDFYTGYNFEEVLDVVTEFLDENTNETVLISYQKEHEHGDGEPIGTFCEVLDSYIYQVLKILKNLTSRQPQLSNCRHRKHKS